MKRGENKSGGIIKTEKGWGYRLIKTINGKRHDITRTTDENRQPFVTKKAAQEARAAHLLKLTTVDATKDEKTYYITFSEAWNIFINTEAGGKEASTVTKYKSVWRNHVEPEFGKKDMCTTTVNEMYKFLCEKYTGGYGYGYVESFLKVFYLLYGVALRAERITRDKYTILFVDKSTKLHMPSPRAEDEEREITILNSAQINIIERVCREKDNGDMYTLFMLCYYCGLRLGEAVGLMWSDIKLMDRTLTVCRQLQYYPEKKMFMITSCKTKNAKRTIDVPEPLIQHLSQFLFESKKRERHDVGYKNTEKVLDMTKSGNNVITSGDFVNRRKNGTLITEHSIKRIVKEIKAAGVTDFHFHALRSTHASILAAANVPPATVMRRMGHSKFDTTLKFYINETEDAHKQLLEALSKINTKEKMYWLICDDGTRKKITEDKLQQRIDFANDYSSNSKLVYEPVTEENDIPETSKED